MTFYDDSHHNQGMLLISAGTSTELGYQLHVYTFRNWMDAPLVL